MPATMPRFPVLAATLRGYMMREGITARDLNDRLGVRRVNSSTHGWIAGTQKPQTKTLAKIAKLTGVPVTQLIGEEPRGVADVPVVAAGVVAVAPVHDMLLVAFRSDGTARIRMDVTLDHTRAMPLLRTLMDAGLVVENE